MFASVAFFWFSSPVLISGIGDFSFVYSPNNEFLKSLYVWTEQDLGDLTSRNTARLFLYYLPIRIMSSIGISLTNIEKIIFYLFLFSSGVGTYVLIKYALSNKGFSRASAFLGANLYMFNLYTLQFHWHHAISLFSYSILPLIFYYYLKLLNTGNSKYAIIIGILSFFASPSGDNPLYFGIIPTLILSYFIYDLVVSRRNILLKTKNTLICFTMIILINSFWILPNLITMPSQLTTIEQQPYTEIRHMSKFESSISVADSYRFLGHWGFKGGYKGLEYYPYHEIYYTPIFIALGFSIIIIASISLFNKNRITLFFPLVALIAFCLIQGPNSSLGRVYMFLWKNLPGFNAFRRPLDKFGTYYIFGISAMFSMSAQYILSKISKVRSKKLRMTSLIVSFLLFLSTINIYAFPFWTGDIFPHYPPRSPLSGGRIILPGYYISISNVVNLKEDVRILGLPSGGGMLGYWVPYKWKYLGKDPLYSYFPTYYKPNVRPRIHADIVSSYIYNIEHTSDFEELKNILKYTNIKYIFIREDVNPNFYPWTSDPEKIAKLLNATSYAKCLGRYGMILLYTINNNPHIYTASPMEVVLLKLRDNSAQSLRFLLKNFKGIQAFFIFKDLSLEQINKIGRANFAFVHERHINITVYDGRKKLFSWGNLINNSIEARYYYGWKPIIRTDGKEREDTLSFASLRDCPYKFPSYSSRGWRAYNSTLIYIRTNESPLVISSIMQGKKPMKGIIGVWWETGWMGMGTKPVEFPIVIPPGQRAIIQINHIIKGNITLNILDVSDLGKLGEIKPSHLPTLIFKRVNPTKYIVSVENATQPFFLVFSESYNPGWKLYIEDSPANFTKIIERYPNINVEEAEHDWYKFTPADIVYLFRKPSLNETYHFKANGYANTWYIDPKEFDRNGDGRFTIVIYFLPQSLFYLGLFISISSLFFCIGYLIYDWGRGRGWRNAERLLKSLAVGQDGKNKENE